MLLLSRDTSLAVAAMMNSNPNESPGNDDHQNKPIALNESLDQKISVSKSIDIGPNDVLCGRSKASFNHGKFLEKSKRENVSKMSSFSFSLTPSSV